MTFEYDYKDLTPTEELFIEVLAGRWRAGEKLWTFSNRMKRTANRLEDKGLVWTMHGMVERTFRAGLTAGGEKLCLDPKYTPPGPKHKVPGGEHGHPDSFPRAMVTTTYFPDAELEVITALRRPMNTPEEAREAFVADQQKMGWIAQLEDRYCTDDEFEAAYTKFVARRFMTDDAYLAKKNEERKFGFQELIDDPIPYTVVDHPPTTEA